MRINNQTFCLFLFISIALYKRHINQLLIEKITDAELTGQSSVLYYFLE